MCHLIAFAERVIIAHYADFGRHSADAVFVRKSILQPWKMTALCIHHGQRLHEQKSVFLAGRGAFRLVCMNGETGKTKETTSTGFVSA
jgi:hypothetical protein